ncbi:hypothetical protein GOV14_04335 [Candidatus Pacearchaeota archaeon]|nr:hypothetical protein [Candidatus Pacearchaeota archaeon]
MMNKSTDPTGVICANCPNGIVNVRKLGAVYPVLCAITKVKDSKKGLSLHLKGVYNRQKFNYFLEKPGARMFKSMMNIHTAKGLTRRLLRAYIDPMNCNVAGVAPPSNNLGLTHITRYRLEEGLDLDFEDL